MVLREITSWHESSNDVFPSDTVREKRGCLQTVCFIVETKCHSRRVTLNTVTWQPQTVLKQGFINIGEMLLTLWVCRLLTAHLKVVMLACGHD